MRFLHSLGFFFSSSNQQLDIKVNPHLNHGNCHIVKLRTFPTTPKRPNKTPAFFQNAWDEKKIDGTHKNPRFLHFSGYFTHICGGLKS